jgi:PAS domain S-box-containing protein
MITITSPDPILLITAIILTIMAFYTALDLLALIKSSESNGRFLFIGGIASMSIGLWVMNFLLMYSVNDIGFASYDFLMAAVSICISLSFTGIAFYIFYRKQIKSQHILLGSLLMTIATYSTHLLGVYALQITIQYDLLTMIAAILLIFLSFFFAFWVLYTESIPLMNIGWVKPLCSFIITAGIGEGFYILTTKSTLYHTSQLSESSQLYQPFLFYIAMVVSVIILSGLMFSRVLINNRLETSDANNRDITTALDASSIVAITDPRGTITYANDKFIEISKYSREEILGANHRILNSGYHSKEFFKNLWATIGRGNVWKGEIRNKAKDGSFYWVDTTIVPFLNKKGKPYQYVSIRTDITERKQAQENLQNTLKELSDIKYALDESSIVAITDQRGRITQVNDKFVEISKYSREELIGQNHSILNSGYHSREFFKDLWRTIGKGSVWQGELCNRAKDGTNYWLDTTIVPFLDDNGKPYQYLAIRIDITERKRTEEIIHRQDKLAAVGQLAAGVAHEIRNPLTSMKGYTEFLTMDEEDENRKEYLEIILDEIERVDSIVEDFMVLAKPKADQMEIKNVIPVMGNVISLLDYEARKNKVKLHFQYTEEDMKAVIDENRMKQVFLNFIKNGVEAMPNGGDMNVKINDEDDHIYISISDNGVGIPPEKLKKIGEPFFTTKQTGNGLGLMVSFKIIESHRGHIEIESRQNQGTTFTITLPKPETT